MLAISVSASYALSDGAAARSVLEAAGPEIQQELDSAKPSTSPSTGSVVVTQGYRLKARSVLHGVLKKWKNGQDDAETVSTCTLYRPTSMYRSVCSYDNDRLFISCLNSPHKKNPHFDN